MIESVPAIAPMSPPLTGASSIVAPRAFARSARRRAGPGRDAAHVDDDGARLHALKTPLGPSRTNSTSGESGTIVMMRVA